MCNMNSDSYLPFDDLFFGSKLSRFNLVATASPGDKIIASSPASVVLLSVRNVRIFRVSLGSRLFSTEP